MKRINASLMTVAVVLALIAFVAPSSAYSIDGVSVECESGVTTWKSYVACDDDDRHDISNFVFAWCNKGAVKEVWVGNQDLTKEYQKDPGWDYGDFYGVHGIKIDYLVVKGESFLVTIKLEGDYCSNRDYVAYKIKADGNVYGGTVYGPVACNCSEIPEFTTIALPIASILGLLFFFNHRKHRKEE